MRGKFSCAVAIIVSILTASGANAAQDVLLAIDEAYPPYSFKSGNGVVGIYPTILEEVFSRMPEYDVTLLPVPWKRAVRMAEVGDVLGVVPPYRREDLRPWMGYSEPIFDEKIVVICRTEVATELSGKTYPDDYAGLVFGNIAGSRAGGEPLHAMTEKGVLKIDEAKSTANNLRKIANGRIDCYVDDINSIESTWRTIRAADPTLIRNFSKVTDVSIERAYIGLTGTEKYPFKDDFVRKFNSELAELRESGEVDRIVREFLGK